MAACVRIPANAFCAGCRVKGRTESLLYVIESGFQATERRVKEGLLMTQLVNNPGGLAAVWAEENNRNTLFEAMQKKEVYATSGTRIKLRFFLNFNSTEEIYKSIDPIVIIDIFTIGNFVLSTFWIICINHKFNPL